MLLRQLNLCFQIYFDSNDFRRGATALTTQSLYVTDLVKVDTFNNVAKRSGQLSQSSTELKDSQNWEYLPWLLNRTKATVSDYAMML